MVRDFTPDDQVAMRRLVLDGLRERWGEEFADGFNPDLDDIAANYVERDAEVVVLEEASEIVATGILIPESDQRGRIVRMSVDVDHRRRGLARQVVAELIARARRREMREVLVLTDTPWSSAVALYKACGFNEVGHDATDTHFVIIL